MTTCVGCGNPLMAGVGDLVPGSKSLRAHAGCITTYGLGAKIEDVEPARSMGDLLLREKLELVAGALAEVFEDEENLSPRGLRLLRRAGLLVGSSLVDIRAAESLVENA